MKLLSRNQYMHYQYLIKQQDVWNKHIIELENEISSLKDNNVFISRAEIKRIAKGGFAKAEFPLFDEINFKPIITRL